MVTVWFYTNTIEMYFFYVDMTVYRVKYLIIKPIRCTNFSNLFVE